MAETVTLYIWDTANSKWVKLAGTPAGAMSIHAIVEELNDIRDVNVPAPAPNDILYWDFAASRWQDIAHLGVADAHHARYTDAEALAAAEAKFDAHKDRHDPQDGDDPLDTAIPVKVAAANAIGTSHSLARADHVHEREHAKYTDVNAVDAMGVLGDANPLNHDRAEEWGATEHTLIGDGAPHHVKYTGAEAVAAVKADDGLPIAAITFIIDGGGEVITTGQKGHLIIPFDCTITWATLLADQAGAIVVDIWKKPYATFPPTDEESITSATPPTIPATNQKSSDATLTDWTVDIDANDTLAFNVDSCAAIKRVTLALKVTKT